MSTIEWTDETWNPLTGCQHVSEGCDNCYAARETSGRLKNHPAYEGLAKDGKFTGEVRLLPDRLDQPLRWRKPRLVFVNSMSDLFHDDVPDEFIAQVFAVMARAPQHIFQVLTKRPARMARWVNRVAKDPGGWITHNGEWTSAYGGTGIIVSPDEWPLPNVWLGTSVENQKWADVRIPHLLKTPAAVRFLSCEPLLGPVDLGAFLDELEFERDDGVAAIYRPKLRWVIVGGESGPGARPMYPDWARSLRDQSVFAGVPYFFKQWGEFAPARNGEAWQVGTEFWPVWRYGKKKAGREFDGRTWDEMPETAEGG